jgi:hypothetical protein
MSVIINGTSGISTDGGSELFGSGSIGGSLTLTSGTANGVTYLNGSKVLTSGSALTFDGSNLAVPAEVYRTSATSYLRLSGGDGAGGGANVLAFGQSHASAAGRLALSAVGTGDIISNTISGTHIYQINSSEQMRLNSTGLGIGTSSPSEKLDVAGRMSITTTTSPAAQGQYGYNFLGGTYIWPKAGSYSDLIIYRSDGNVGLQMTSSGNLGLGVTPSAWGAVIRALQVNETGMSLFTYTAAGTVDQYAFLTNNSYQNSGYADTYVRTNPAAQYRQLNATHAWFNAPSGTAGAAISFTQAMTLTSAGELLVGTTSLPTGGGILTASSSAAETKVNIVNTGASGRHYWIGSTNTSSGAVGGGKLAIYDQTSNATRLAIDSSGNVGIGTSSPGTRLQVNQSEDGSGITLSAGFRGASRVEWEMSGVSNEACSFLHNNNTNKFVMQTMSRDTLLFHTNNTERMRIDSAGRLLIGGTSTYDFNGQANLVVNGTSNLATITVASTTSGHLVFADGTSGTALYAGNIAYNHASNTMTFGTDGIFERVTIDSSGNFKVSSGQAILVGGLAVGTSSLQGSVIYFGSSVISAGAGTYPLKWNSSTGIVTYDTSSRLVKENIEDSPYGLAEVLQLKSRKYHRTDDQRDEIGLVADEVQAVMPEFVPLVAKSIFTKDEADTELIAGGVNYDKLTSVLVKAIQEQQALIEQLQADVATLKGAA